MTILPTPCICGLPDCLCGGHKLANAAPTHTTSEVSVTPMVSAVLSAHRYGVVTHREQRLLDNWLNIQGINLARHARSLRPFAKDEFGNGPTAPSKVHIEAVNRFIDRLRDQLVERARWVEGAATAARREPTTARLHTLLERKQAVGANVLYVESIWDFYFDLFVQRLSKSMASEG